MPHHYVYLIQIGDVYKIGRTEVNEGLQFNRFRAYPPNSNLVLMRQVDGPHVERQIIHKFSNKFEKVGTSLEYFRGDVNLMVQIVYDLTSSFHVDTISDRNFRINIRGELTDKDCDELRNELGCLPFGGTNFYWKNSNGTEDKIKSIYRPHVFSTVIWTRTGTPLRRLVEFVKILEAKKFRVLSTEGFTWIDDKLTLCEGHPRAVWNSVDHFLESSVRVKKDQDTFVPLDAVTAIYAEFLNAWEPSSGTSITAKECVKDYHEWCAARGLPKAKVMLGDLLKALESHGFHVDPTTFVVSSRDKSLRPY